MRVGLIQTSVSDDPAANLPVTTGLIRQAAAGGASFIATPECTNLISSDRAWQREVLREEGEDPTLRALADLAGELSVWLLAGSILLKTGGDRFANRSVLIGPDGGIRARYDKIHMFDVDLAGGESYRESAAFRPGDAAVLAQTPWGQVGLTICYDMRFAALYRHLAQAGAALITVPAAFTVPTGRAHWEVLLRARAIETGAFILAPAQTGTHAQRGGRVRQTWGHSLVVGPWGEVLADAGEGVGVTLCDLDLAEVTAARSRVPSLTHDRDFRPVAR